MGRTHLTGSRAAPARVLRRFRIVVRTWAEPTMQARLGQHPHARLGAAPRLPIGLHPFARSQRAMSSAMRSPGRAPFQPTHTTDGTFCHLPLSLAGRGGGTTPFGQGSTRRSRLAGITLGQNPSDRFSGSTRTRSSAPRIRTRRHPSYVRGQNPRQRPSLGQHPHARLGGQHPAFRSSSTRSLVYSGQMSSAMPQPGRALFQPTHPTDLFPCRPRQ